MHNNTLFALGLLVLAMTVSPLYAPSKKSQESQEDRDEFKDTKEGREARARRDARRGSSNEDSWWREVRQEDTGLKKARKFYEKFLRSVKTQDACKHVFPHLQKFFRDFGNPAFSELWKCMDGEVRRHFLLIAKTQDLELFHFMQGLHQ